MSETTPKFKYCVQHKKLLHVLPLDMRIDCVNENHDIIDYNFDDVYHAAMRKAERNEN